MSPPSTLTLPLTSVNTIQPVAPPPRSQSGLASAQLLLAQIVTVWRRLTASVRAVCIDVDEVVGRAGHAVVGDELREGGHAETEHDARRSSA